LGASPLPDRRENDRGYYENRAERYGRDGEGSPELDAAQCSRSVNLSVNAAIVRHIPGIRCASGALFCQSEEKTSLGVNAPHQLHCQSKQRFFSIRD